MIYLWTILQWLNWALVALVAAVVGIYGTVPRPFRSPILLAVLPFITYGTIWSFR